VQLLGFFVVYLFGGVGCAIFAFLHFARRNPLDLLSMVLLWPLCAPFLFADAPRRSAALPAQPRPEEEREILSTHCGHLEGRLREIDVLLSQEDWNPERLAAKRNQLSPDHMPSRSAFESLTVRMEHIERLAFLRKVRADELEEAQSLLDQLNSQEQLSRFLVARDGEALSHLDAIRARIADSESVLASEAELIALCHESL
jgi:hypothetical protein